MARVWLLFMALVFCFGQELKDYATVIPNTAKTQDGIFKVHQVGAVVYYEIPSIELGKPFLWWTRIARAPSMLGYGNEPVASDMVAWELHQNRVLLLRGTLDYPVADANLPIARSVAATSNPTIIMSFPVQTYAPNGNVVIDATNLFTTDVPEFSARAQLKGQGFDASRSFIERVTAFPSNIDVEVTCTYTAPADRPPPQDLGTGLVSSMAPGSASLVLHHSMLRLPDQPMRPRLANPRVGFLTRERVDFSLETNRAPVRRFAERWRLEKKDPSATISDPVKPIEIYVDPATPSKWVRYVKQGIEDWRPALEGAGFRNAIVAREVPSGDKDWSSEDARYTVVNWQPLIGPFAFTGPMTDPRSGEILTAQIQFFHGIIDRMAGNYFVQVGPLDPRALKWPLADDIVGELIRYVVAHEVGHALGLDHNMKGSAMYPAEKVRDPRWVREMGYSPSIEDYSRFNYVAQPEDGFAQEDLVPRMGPYDRWAIHWGYAVIPGAPGPEDEKPTLDVWAREQEKTPWLRWVTENGGEADPTDRMEAVGDADPISSTALGVKNLRRVMDMLIPATAQQNWHDLEYLYKRVLGQWTNEMLTVAGWVGGMISEEKVKVADGVRFTIVPKERQKAAVRFLNRNAFATPQFLIRADIMRRIEPSGESDHILEAQAWILRTLVSPPRLNRMMEQEEMDGAAAYGPADFVADVRKGIWSEVYSGSQIGLWRRNLQLSYVELMASRRYGPGGGEYRAIVRGDLVGLEADLASAIARPALDRTTRNHLLDMRQRVRDILDPKTPPAAPPPEPEQPKYFPLR
jgi:hypothetical protein